MQVLSNYAYLGSPLGEGEGSKSKLNYSMLAAPTQAEHDDNGLACTIEHPSNSASAGNSGRQPRRREQRLSDAAGNCCGRVNRLSASRTASEQSRSRDSPAGVV